MSYYQGLSLADKIAVVIGGTSGIGRTISLGFAQAGAHVIPTSRRQDQVDETASAIEELGRKSLRITSDVTDRDSLQHLLDTCVKRFDHVDILVNSAGRILKAPTIDFPEEKWNAVLDTNLTGTLRACQIFGKHMIDRDYGRIINIASLNTFVAFCEVAAYAASKAAVASLTRSLAVEWASFGVCVNAIAPGVFKTDLNADLLDKTGRGHELLMRTPMSRFGHFEELVGAAIFLASDSASFTTGQIIVVDGGFLASGVNQ